MLLQSRLKSLQHKLQACLSPSILNFVDAAGSHLSTLHHAFTPRLAVDSPVCIVTGGARGIGRAIATMLGATGAKVLSVPLPDYVQVLSNNICWQLRKSQYCFSLWAGIEHCTLCGQAILSLCVPAAFTYTH